MWWCIVQKSMWALPPYDNTWFNVLFLVPPILGMFAPYLVSLIPARLSNLDGKQPPKMAQPNDGPPAPEVWRSMSFLQRMDYAARDCAARSPSAFSVYWHHIALWVWVFVSNMAFLYFCPRPDDMDNDEWAKQALIKSIVWHMVNEATGWAKQGTLWGGGKMPDSWKYGLTLGSCKQPMVEQVTLIQRLFDRNAPDVWAYEKEAGIIEKYLPWTFGDKRTIIDVARYATFIVFSVVGVWLPRMPTWWLGVIVGCAAHQMVSDFHMWMQCVGYTYMHFLIPALFALEGPEWASQGALAGMQCILLFQRIGCGVAKAGPWWAFVIGRYAQSHPFVRESDNYRSLINAGPDDLAPSKFVKWTALFASMFEIWVPFLPFFTFCPPLVWFGVSALTALHMFIIFGPAFIDVVAWNIAFIMGDLYLFTYTSEHKPLGFDWNGLWNAHPLLKVFIFVDLLAITVANQYPEKLSRYWRHAHYAGNWPKCVIMLKKSAAKKILDNVKWYGNVRWAPQDTLAGEYGAYRGMAYSWLFQLNSKTCGALTQVAYSVYGNRAEDYYYNGPHYFMEFLQGAGCDGQQTARFVRMLARECKLEPGDLITIDQTPFPILEAWKVPYFNPNPGQTTKSRWMIHDSVEGIKHHGYTTMDDNWGCCSLPSHGLVLLPKELQQICKDAEATATYIPPNAEGA